MIIIGILVFFILRRRRRRLEEPARAQVNLNSPEPYRGGYPGLPPPMSQVQANPHDIIPGPHPLMYGQGSTTSGSTSDVNGAESRPPRNIMTVTHRSQSPNSRGAPFGEGISSMNSSATDSRNISAVTLGENSYRQASEGSTQRYHPNRRGGAAADPVHDGMGMVEEEDGSSPFDDRNRAPTPRRVFVHEDAGSIRGLNDIDNRADPLPPYLGGGSSRI